NVIGLRLLQVSVKALEETIQFLANKRLNAWVTVPKGDMPRWVVNGAPRNQFLQPCAYGQLVECLVGLAIIPITGIRLACMNQGRGVEQGIVNLPHRQRPVRSAVRQDVQDRDKERFLGSGDFVPVHLSLNTVHALLVGASLALAVLDEPTVGLLRIGGDNLLP